MIYRYEDDAPKCKYFGFRTVASMLNIKGMGRNNLLKFLREKDILDRYNQPYKKYVEQGYFSTFSHYTTPSASHKGINFIRQLIKDSNK